MSELTFYWHDYETFGADPARDRPVQFAGLRTDANLEPIGEKAVEPLPGLRRADFDGDRLILAQGGFLSGLVRKRAHNGAGQRDSPRGPEDAVTRRQTLAAPGGSARMAPSRGVLSGLPGRPVARDSPPATADPIGAQGPIPMTAVSNSSSARRGSSSSSRRATAKSKANSGTSGIDRRHVAIMDTTLRDGEQTPNVSYTPAEKLQLARMLLVDCEIDRIEMASTRVSAGELEAAQTITKWARKARLIQRIEMLGYTDGKKSVDWICNAGGKVLNLLTKGSEKHCTQQLGLTPEQHREKISETIRYARRKRLTVNVYLEDWSSGVRDSFDYVSG